MCTRCKQGEAEAEGGWREGGKEGGRERATRERSKVKMWATSRGA